MKSASELLQLPIQDTKAACEHQELMGLLQEEGWLTGRYTAMWGKLLKNSGINSIDLKRLIDAAKASKYDTRGVVRNALRDRSWTKYF